jgi:hypothetical protein
MGLAARSLVLALALASPRAAGAEADAELGGEVVIGAHPAAQRARPAQGTQREWYLPDHAKLQLAGDIGFLSPGIGWELAGRRVHVDLFLGWVPASIGGEDIYSATAKAVYAPWRLRASPRWRLEPLRIGAQVTYTFGSQYFLTSPSRYPSGYYEIPTALHGGAALGASAACAIGRGGEREVGLYAEIVALVDGLKALWENPNVIDPSDVVSVAIGTFVRF